MSNNEIKKENKPKKIRPPTLIFQDHDLGH